MKLIPFSKKRKPLIFQKKTKRVSFTHFAKKLTEYLQNKHKYVKMWWI